MNNALWTIVTVTFNSERFLRTHWPADPSERDYHWIIIDNSSTDGTVELARRQADLVIEAGLNLGFSAANNLGLAHTATPYVMFVNPDVVVPQDGWQETLRQTVDAARALVAPQLVNWDGSRQPNARGMPYLALKVLHRVSPMRAERLGYTPPKGLSRAYCAWVMGAAVGGRTSDFHNLGGWNSQYFLYYEDHDLGLRAWQGGLSVVIDGRSRWIHDWQRSTSNLDLKAWKYELKSMATFYRQYPRLLFGTGSRFRPSWTPDQVWEELDHQGED